MVHKFIPFETMISCSSEIIAKIDPNLHLNVEDPTTKLLLKTSAFKIKEIQEELKRFNEFLVESQN